MKITTLDYPTPVLLPMYSSDGSAERPGFNITISGCNGRQLRVVGANVDTTDSYDNVYIRDDVTFSALYLQNGTAQTVSNDIRRDPAEYGVGPSHAYATGAFEFTLEIETGIATDVFVPLAESGVDYTTSDYPGANIVVAAPPAPAAPCFWTDLVRAQDSCGAAPPPDPPGEEGFISGIADGMLGPFVNISGGYNEADACAVFDALFDAPGGTPSSVVIVGDYHTLPPNSGDGEWRCGDTVDLTGVTHRSFDPPIPMTWYAEGAYGRWEASDSLLDYYADDGLFALLLIEVDGVPYSVALQHYWGD